MNLIQAIRKWIDGLFKKEYKGDEMAIYQLDMKGSNGIDFKGTFIDQEEVEKIKESYQKELDKREKEREELEMANKKLKKAIEELQDKSKSYGKEIEKLKSKDKEQELKLQQLDKDLMQSKQQAISEIQSLQSEKEKILKELETLQGEVKPQLYELYKQVCPTGDNYAIKSENLYTFLITSGQVEVLENIASAVQTTKGANSNEVELFNQLFESLQQCYNLERIEAKVGEEYNESLHTKLEGDAQGQISEVILNGFKKNGNVKIKSFVKVKK